MTSIVFLHIPKTAGQNVHHALAAIVGKDKVSPVRVNEQARDGKVLLPGYQLHSGHLDWTDLEALGDDRFVFTILRDPGERIGSFYFFMREQARTADAATREKREGLQMIHDHSVDDYFFGGSPRWRGFVRNMYFNFYCSYFATRRFSGRNLLDRQGLDHEAILQKALDGSRVIDRIYRIENLAALENDIHQRFGERPRIASRRVNQGGHGIGEGRWKKLLARFERDESVRMLRSFVEEDRDLMARLEAEGRLV